MNEAMDVFEKVDWAIEALTNAAKKTEFTPPASNAEIARFNAFLEEANLPQLPVDFMYLLSKFGSCKGPYFEIYGIEDLQGAQKPTDVTVIEMSVDLNEKEDDGDPKGLLLGHMPHLRPYYKLIYKNGIYHEVEDDRGVLNYFPGPDNIGDFILKEMNSVAAALKEAEVEEKRREVEKWSD